MDKSSGVVDQAMRDRLCVLAHDLNNAMTAVAGHCELILEHADPGSECEKRLHQILMIVYTIAKRINGHECRMTTPVAQNTADLDTLLSSIQNSTQPSLSTIPTTSKPAKAG